MAATNHTPVFQLNQWEGSDPVLREDFNGDNLKIEQALSRCPRIAVGSYVGTGTCGSKHPNSLTFDFEPKLVVLEVNKAGDLRPGTVFVGGQTYNSGMGFVSSSFNTLDLHISWEGNTVSWYTNTDADEGEKQFNSAGTTYFYFAIGL